MFFRRYLSWARHRNLTLPFLLCISLFIVAVLYLSSERATSVKFFGPSKQSLKIENSKFVLKGRPIQIISGAIHYFRVPQEYWYDRLRKLKACGLNTVETYVPWNLHEKTGGKFDFDGILDISKFLEIAQELGECYCS